MAKSVIHPRPAVHRIMMPTTAIPYRYPTGSEWYWKPFVSLPGFDGSAVRYSFL